MTANFSLLLTIIIVLCHSSHNCLHQRRELCLHVQQTCAKKWAGQQQGSGHSQYHGLPCAQPLHMQPEEEGCSKYLEEYGQLSMELSEHLVKNEKCKPDHIKELRVIHILRVHGVHA